MKHKERHSTTTLQNIIWMHDQCFCIMILFHVHLTNYEINANVCLYILLESLAQKLFKKKRNLIGYYDLHRHFPAVFVMHRPCDWWHTTWFSSELSWKIAFLINNLVLLANRTHETWNDVSSAPLQSWFSLNCSLAISIWYNVWSQYCFLQDHYQVWKNH